MGDQIKFRDFEDTRLDENIRKTMGKSFPLPENVEAAKQEAFARIRNRQEKQEYADSVAQRMKKTQNIQKNTKTARRSKRAFWSACAATAAAVTVFSGACITHPAFAAQVPLIGHVFEELGQSLGFSGDFSKYATALDGNTEETTADAETQNAVENNTAADAAQTDGNASEGENPGTGETDGNSSGDTLYTQTKNGMTITLSEVYCNDKALYVSMVLKTDEKFPDTFLMEGEVPLVSIQGSTLKFSYNDREILSEANLEGRLVDDYTFAGVLRFNLDYSTDNTDYEGYYNKRNEFFLSLGITQEELDGMSREVDDKICSLIGAEILSDQAVAQAGGPDINDYRSEVEVPDDFTVELNIPQVVGEKPDGRLPEMPEDLKAEYEQAMKDNGLGITDEDYANFTEEQQELEHQLFTKMYHAYEERYPETTQHPNSYENWWVDGPWQFTFDVTKNTDQTIVKEINDVDENGIGLVSVTKTPFELTVEDGNNIDCFTVALDADGDIMPNGTFGGSSNVMALQDRDVSKVDIYICDYIEYMDELKGYYWSEDYEENKKTKTFKQLLDERALYHKEISFEE